MSDAIQQFKEAMYSVGMTPPESIEPDGQLKRFASGDKQNDKNGWYVLHSDGIPAGAFGDWSKGISQNWQANIDRALTPSEIRAHQIKMEAVKEQRESERLSMQKTAKEKANSLWTRALPASNHPYLLAKQIKPYSAKQIEDSLLIPLYDDGGMASLQIIKADGSKRFLTGGKIAGCYYPIGKIDNAKALCICEGYATGASIHQATGYPVAIAFNAGNLLEVSKTIRAKYPQLTLIVCGDDDYKTQGNPGVTKATEATQAINGLLALPSFGINRKEKATDFNDMVQEAGLEAVRTVIEACLNGHDAEVWNVPVELPTELPVMPFNYELLPESFRPWIKDISHRMNCPPEFPAVASIVCASSLIGAKAVIQPKEKDTGWHVTPNLWGMIIGNAGGLKSPPVKEVMKSINKFETQEREKTSLLLNDWEINKAMTEFSKKEKDNKVKKLVAQGDTTGARALLGEPDAMEDEPKAKRLVVNDTSVEALQTIMADNPWGLLCFRDEIYGLLKSLDKQGQEGSRTFYLTAYDGNQSYATDRIGRDDVIIKRACLSLFGTIQPSRLQEYLKGAITGGSGDDGLIQRFGMMVFPDPIAKYNYVDSNPDLTARDRAHEVYKRLYELEPIGDEPKVWTFTSDAQKLFLDWYIPFNQELISGNTFPALESHLSKYRALIPSLALIFAHIDTPQNDGLVGVTEVGRALDWYEFLRTHAERIYQSASIPQVAGAKTILKKIKAQVIKDGFTPREIALKGWSGLNDVETVRKALAVLVDYDYLRMEKTTPSSVGGRVSESYLINPKALGGGL